MVHEMAKKLGTNVSKFELVSLRQQVESTKQEAERVHETNVALAAKLQKQTASTDSLDTLRAEVQIYQKTNDEMQVGKGSPPREGSPPLPFLKAGKGSPPR